MNAAQKQYLDKEIKRSIKRCRRWISMKRWQILEVEQARLEALWALRQALRKLEVGQ